jgi:hypothetical protein
MYEAAATPMKSPHSVAKQPPALALDRAGTALTQGMQQVLDALQSDLEAPLDPGLITLKVSTHASLCGR